MSSIETDELDVIEEFDEDGSSVVSDEGTEYTLALKSKVEREIKEIEIEDIVVSELSKVGRKDTYFGLTASVKEFGVTTPIHVMELDSGLYVLLSGLRRLFAAGRNGLTKIPAVVWNFEDKEEGKRNANLVSLLINRTQRFSNKEIWSQYQLLERVNGLTVGQIEYYLQLSGGDAVKIKDVMESDFVEIQEEFLSDQLTIEGAYKKLSAERKKINRLAEEDKTTVGLDTGSSNEETMQLSSEEVLNLLEMEETSEDFSELNKSETGEIERQEGVVQDVKNRRPLDEVLRGQVLQRDNMTCQCCFDVGGEDALHIIDIHHIIQVSQGGADILENLITVCINCHHTIHAYAWGKLRLSSEALKSKPEHVQKRYKRIFIYGNKIIEADKRIKSQGGQSAQQIPNRKMPTTDLGKNVKALEAIG